MIKKRSRPQTRVREPSPDNSEEQLQPEDAATELPLADLLELRKLKKSREGIDIDKLNKGDGDDRKRKRWLDEEKQSGLQPGYKHDEDLPRETKRKVIRPNNFTQQTNALDVDKHMMAYIEQKLTVRRKPQPEEASAPVNPYDPMEHIAAKLKEQVPVQSSSGPASNKEDGRVSNSMQMLTAIPEVDLGMNSRIKNIEETEKAKRIAEEEKQKKTADNPLPSDEAHLVANRFYQPNLRVKSDDEILRDAKLEALGITPLEKPDRRDERVHMATDELVLEKFKKRMRK